MAKLDSTPECPETCNFGGGAGQKQSDFCETGTTGSLSADDLGSYPSKKAKFCNGVGSAARCPVSCGTCKTS